MPTNNVLKKVANFLGYSTKDEKRLDYANDMSVDERRLLFKINEAYYSNNIYDRLNDGGALDLINDFLGEFRSQNIKGISNPIKRAVNVYKDSVFAGHFGKEIRIKDTVGEERRAIHPNLKKYFAMIARWSNLDREAKRYVRYGALFGTVGIRVVSKVGRNYPDDDRNERRVYLEFEHPSAIINALRDKRGNVKQIITEYLLNKGDLSLNNRGEPVRQIAVRELMTQSFVERSTQSTSGIAAILPFSIGGQEVKRLSNELGVTPYVIVQHEERSGLFGAWCFQGVERKVDMNNALLAHLDKQIVRHVKSTWTVASNSEPPQQIKLSGQDIIWFKLDEGTSPPAIQDMVTSLSLTETLDRIRLGQDEVADSLPELKCTDGKYLSGQSGETIAQLRLPAEVKVKDARANYEDGLIRATKIAFSYGIMLGIFDFGTGTGSRETAEQAFQTGALDFEFEERDALPITEQERLNTAILRAEAGSLTDAEETNEEPVISQSTEEQNLEDIIVGDDVIVEPIEEA